MKNSFDLVSGFYDSLARFVFGSSWDKIQEAPLKNLVAKKSILIVGGGTGQLLEGLQSHHEAVYVDLSQKMLRVAQQRHSVASIDFIHANYLNWKSTQRFDAIVFPFFLDSFCLEDLNKIIKESHLRLNPNGQLHVVDFEKSAHIHNLLIQVMFIFFRVTAKLGSNKLLDFKSLIIGQGYTVEKEQSFLDGWIWYRVYSGVSMGE